MSLAALVVMTTPRRTLLAFAMTAAFVTPAAAERVDEVFFDYDSSAIGEDLQPVADELSRTPGQRIILEGHADATGTSPYNVGLSTRRAEAVRDALVARGVAPGRFVLALYGEDGERRAHPAQDRRVSIRTTEEPLYAIIDETLDPATAVIFGHPETQVAIDGPGALPARERVALP